MHQGAADVLKWLGRRGSKRVVLGMARYGIPSQGAFGVPMGMLQKEAKRLGKDHALALALWETGRYEAKLLAALVDDPRQVTRRQMDAWAAGFQSWADCDTVCFKLFDQVPFAWEKARQWAKSPREFVRRSLALNAKALATAKRLAQSEEAGCRWVGKDALRELASPRVRARLARRAG